MTVFDDFVLDRWRTYRAAAAALMGPVSKIARLGAGGPLADEIADGAMPTLGQAAKFVGLDTAGNAALMGGAQLATNAADKVIYDPTRSLSDGVGESALMGAGFGALHAPELVGAALRSGGDTVPENATTLATQQQEMVAGKRDAMLFPTGTPELPVPDGFARLKTDAGIFHYDPEVFEPNEIKMAVDEGTIGNVLDYGIPSKPDLTQPHVAVVRRDTQGNEIESVVTDQAHLPQVLQTQGERAEPGQSVRTESPAVVIAQRQATNGTGAPTPDANVGMTNEEFTDQQARLARQKRLDYYQQLQAPMTDDRSQQMSQESAQAQQQAELANAQAALDRAAQLKAQAENEAQAKQEALQGAPDDTVAEHGA